MNPSEFRYIRVHDLMITQADLATDLGVSKDTISNIERSHNSVPKVYELAILHIIWLKKVKPIILELV